MAPSNATRARRPWALVRANAGLRRLLTSLGVSGLGDWMYGIALAVWVLDRTHSPAMVATSVALRLAPFALFGAIGGVAVDRFNRRRLLVTLDVARAALLTIFVAVIALHGPTAVGIGLAALSAVITVPYRAAATAVLSSLVEADELDVANSLEAGLSEAMVLIGPACGALLLQAFSPAAVVGINALTFAVSAVLVARVDATPNVHATSRTRWRHDLRAGLAMIRSTRGAAALLAFSGVCVLGNGALLVGSVVFTEQQLGLGAPAAGFLLSASALGGLLAALVAPRVAARVAFGQLVAVGGAALGVSYIALSRSTNVTTACLAMFAEGVTIVLLYVASMTVWQRTIASDALGRVLGLQDTLMGSCALGAAIVTGALIQYAGVARSFAAMGVVVTVSSLGLSRRVAG